MTLESTILCVDNSDYMRNGDYMPTRALAQQDAVNMICHSKIRSNPENNVGLITMADRQVLVTLTTDTGKIMNQMHLVQPKGNIDFLTSIKIAHLALKHRQGRNHKMRVIIFVGSPIDIDEKEMSKIAKKLKKEKVNVDVVNFGETEANNELLNSFIDILNGKEGTGSHLVTIPPGPVLSEALMTSPIMLREDGSTGTSSSTAAMMMGANAAGTSGISDFEFGIDPNSDPELALALRVSMEEQRARQEAEARAANQQPTGSADASLAPESDNKSNMVEGKTRIASQAPNLDLDSDMTNEEHLTEEEMLLNQALAMSMGLDPSALPRGMMNPCPLSKQTAGKDVKHDDSVKSATTSSASHQPAEAMTEDEEIAMAITLSLQQPNSDGFSENKSRETTPDDGLEEESDEHMELDDPTTPSPPSKKKEGK